MCVCVCVCLESWRCHPGHCLVCLLSCDCQGGTQAMACQRASSTGSHINVKNTANMPNQYANHAVDDGNLVRL